MKVLIDLSDEILSKVQDKADAVNRKRKQMLEMIIEDAVKV